MKREPIRAYDFDKIRKSLKKQRREQAEELFEKDPEGAKFLKEMAKLEDTFFEKFGALYNFTREMEIDLINRMEETDRKVRKERMKYYSRKIEKR